MKRKNYIHPRVVGWILLVLFILSCARNPVTGKRQLMLLSQEDEIELGKQTDKEIVQIYGIYSDPELEEFITSLGKEMAKISHRPDLPYTFRLLDSPVINAFAVPGGFVYITRGILSFLNSEAEFAGVLGHEIGHITARHSAQQYSKAQLAQLGLGIGAIISEDFRRYAGLAEFGVGLLFLKFSRDHERQSDELGVEYSTKVGYDATHMANFFETLHRMEESSDQAGLPSWLSTHPSPDEREQRIKELAAEWKQKVNQTNFVVKDEEFLRRVEGIVYGEDPRHGYVENGVFYHPELKFQFPVPQNWQLNNTPSQVQMFTEEQDAVILLSLAEANSPQETASDFVSQTGANVQISEAVTVNGLSAYRVISRIADQQNDIQVLSLFIQKDQYIYQFHGFSAPGDFNRYQPVFSQTMSEFRPLTDQSKINVKPATLVLKKAPRSAPLKDILTELGVPSDKLEHFALINGKRLEESVEANALIKVASKYK